MDDHRRNYPSNSNTAKQMKRKAGIYIHFPFCKIKCGYCDFYSITDREDSIPLFIDCLIHEIDLYFDSHNTNLYNFDSIFMGGGTPSLIEPIYIEKIFKTLSKYIDMDYIEEATIEANPGESPKERLKEFRKLGINRISFGFQSLDNKLLKFLDRLHSSEQCISAFNDAREAGFDNINTDMIFNIPGQSIDTLTNNMQSIIDLNPEHISSYSLTVEKGTMLYNNVSKGKVIMPDENLDYEMYKTTSSILKNNSYIQYEASNYSKNHQECIHNLHYWNLDPYLAFGPSAHGYDGEKRWWNHRSLGIYISQLQKSKLPINNSEKLTKKDQYNEMIMNGLRTSKGVKIDNLNSICNNIDFSLIVKKWPQLTIDGAYLKLGNSDFMLLDEITADLFI